jgi:hypothetical protein
MEWLKNMLQHKNEEKTVGGMKGLPVRRIMSLIFGAHVLSGLHNT